jgi:single-stranded DNA-binding protein
MQNINQLIIEGNMSCDPELRFTSTGNKAVTNFNIYVDSKYKSKASDEITYIKNTSKVPVVAWAGKAQYISNTFGKGDKVRLVGHIKTKEILIDDRKILTFEVIAKDIYLIRKNTKSSD